MKLITLLDRDELAEMVGGFATLAASPLFVVDEEGEIIAEAGRAEFDCRLEGRFTVREGVVHCTEETCAYRVGQTCAPIEVYGKRLGLVVGCRGQAAQAITLLSGIISRWAKEELELNSLSEEILDKYEEINLLYEIGEALGAVFDTEQICRLVLEKAVQVIAVQKASVMLLDEAAGVLRIAAAVGIPQPDSVAVRLGEGISGRVAQSGKPLLVDNIDDLPDRREGTRSYEAQSLGSVSPLAEERAPEYRTKSLLSVPLVCSPQQGAEKVLGVINMADKQSGQAFTSEDLKLLTAIAGQAAIAIYNSQLVEELKKAERVKKEMEIARRIQMSLLPEKPPRVEGLELAGRCVPAGEVGGDYYDFFAADGKVGLLVADVSGHGVGSALMMAITRGVLRSEIARARSPAEALASTNAAMYEDLSQAELFITAFYASYDKKTRTLAYANGGHNLPFVWRVREGQRTLLNAEGMLIGVLKDVSYEERTFQLQPGDVLVFYTDGVTEAMNEQGEPFGEERLYRLVQEKGHLSAPALLDEICRRVRQFSGGVAQHDDITIVIMKVL